MSAMRVAYPATPRPPDIAATRAPNPAISSCTVVSETSSGFSPGRGLSNSYMNMSRSSTRFAHQMSTALRNRSSGRAPTSAPWSAASPSIHDQRYRAIPMSRIALR